MKFFHFVSSNWHWGTGENIQNVSFQSNIKENLRLDFMIFKYNNMGKRFEIHILPDAIFF